MDDGSWIILDHLKALSKWGFCSPPHQRALSEDLDPDPGESFGTAVVQVLKETLRTKTLFVFVCYHFIVYLLKKKSFLLKPRFASSELWHATMSSTRVLKVSPMERRSCPFINVQTSQVINQNFDLKNQHMAFVRLKHR